MADTFIEFVIQDLDDEHLVVDSKQVDYVKQQLEAQLAENTFNPAETGEAS